MEESIGGVILYDETIRQAADDGTPFAELLAAKGVVPGIKVDTGAHDMAGFPGEKVTEGLDGLRARLEEYARARRAVREVARRDHDRGRHPDRRVPPRERPRPRPVRGALPGGGPRADRRARGADGRRQHDRDLRRRDRAHAPRGVRRALRPGRPPARDAAEAEHGDRRQGRAGAGAARPGGAPRRCTASSAMCPRSCPGSCSSRAGSPRWRRRRT